MANGDESKKKNSSWQDVGSGKYRHGVKAAIEAQEDIPVYEETVDETATTTDAAETAVPTTATEGETAAAEFDWSTAETAGVEDPALSEYEQWLRDHPAANAQYNRDEAHTLGYDATFWQDPKKVARYYNVIKATPPGTTLPEWMTPEFQQQVEQAYKYFEFRNGSEPWTNWKYLNKNDQALPLLAGMQTPPNEFLWAGEEKFAQGATQGPNIEAVMTGQAAWNALPEDQRKALLLAPNFDITQYDPMVRQQMLADPNFNWEALPPWQKTYYNLTSNPMVAGATQGAVFGTVAGGPIGGVIGGAVGGALGYAAGQSGYDPLLRPWEQTNGIAKLFGWLNYPAEKLEQAVGTIAQIIENPEMINEPYALEAAWEASRLTYEYSQIGTNLFRDLSPMFSDQYAEKLNELKDDYNDGGMAYGDYLKGMVDVWNEVAGPRAGVGQDYIVGSAEPVYLYQPPTGGTDQAASSYFLEQAREKIAADVASGRPIRDVVNEMLVDSQQYAGAQLKDMLIQSMADPLNVLPEIQGKVLTQVVKSDVLPTFKGGWDNPSKIVTELKAAVQTASPETIAELPALTRFIAGVNKEGGIKTGMFGLYPSETLSNTKLDPNEQVGFLGIGAKSLDSWGRHILTLNPEARARTGISMAMDTLGTILNTLDVDQIEPFFTALSKSDMGAMKELAGNVVGSAEFYTVLPMLQGWNKLGELAGMWELSAENRGLLGRLSDVLGMDAARLVEDLGKRDGAARVFEQVRSLVSKGTDAISKALLDDMNAGRFTVEDLQAIGKTFNGADALPWHPGAYKAMVMDSLGEHAANWSKGYFGLKPDSGVLRLAHTLKAAQGLLLLGINPGYAVTNIINNTSTMIFTGTFGMMTPGQIRGFADRLGFTPDRMREGVGMMGEATYKGKADKVLSEAKAGKGGWAKADSIMRSVNKLGVFASLSKSAESIQSSQAFTVGMQKGWDRFWKRGSGFRNMDAGLVKMLRDIDPRYVDMVYRAIEGGLNQKEIVARLQGTEKMNRAQDLIHNAAKETGMTTSQAVDLLNKAGILEPLNAYLSKADTWAKIDYAFDSIDQRVTDFVDMKTGMDARNKAEHVANAINAEGSNRFWEVVLDNWGFRNDKWVDHFMKADETAALAESIPDEFQGQKSLAWLEYFRKDQREYKHVNGMVLSNLKGMITALGLDTPEARKIVTLLGEQFKSWDDAYKFRMDQHAQHYETWKGKFTRDTMDARMAEIEAMHARTDEVFKKAFEAERIKEEQIRDALTEQVRMKYGDAAADGTRAAYQRTLDFRADMVKKLQKHRQDVKNLYGADRRAANKKFYNDYIYDVLEMRRVFEESVALTQDAINGKPPPPPVGEAGAPVKPTPPPTGPSAPGRATPPDPTRPEYGSPSPTERASVGEGSAVTPTADNVWKVAGEVGITGLDQYGNQVFGAKLDVIKFVKKWGGTDGAHIKTFADISSDLMRKAVDSKKAWEQDQLSLPKIGDDAEALKTESEGLAEPKEATNEASDKALASAQDVQSVKVESKVANKHIADLPPVIRDSLQYELSVMRSILSDEPARNIFTAIREQGGIDPKFAKEMFGTSAQEMGMPPGFWRKDGFDPYRMAILLAEDGWPIDVKNPFDMDGIESLKKMIERRKGRSESWSDAFKTKKAREDALFALDALTRGLDKPDQVLYQNLKGIAEAMVLDDPVISERWDWAKAWGAEDDILFRIDQRMKAVVDEALQAAADGDAVTMDMKFNQFIEIMSETPKEIAGEFIKVMNDEGKRIATDETYSQYFDRMYDELDKLNEAAQSEHLNALTVLSILDQEAVRDVKMDRNLLREKLEALKKDQPEAEQQTWTEQVDFALKVLDARAEKWALDNKSTPAEWYASRVADVARTDVIPDLMQGRIEPVNRRMTPEELQNYTRALVRSGVDELRRAVQSEPNKADRIAILDAAHALDAKMAETVARAAVQSDMLFQTAYHGSPHKFDKFTLDHMGTGEGVQAYGWGLYFADSKSVGEYYRDILTSRDGDWIVGYTYRDDIWPVQNRFSGEVETTFPTKAEAEAFVDQMNGGKRPTGQLYKVELPDENYLLWDRPLSEQSPGVRKIIEKLLPSAPERLTGEQIYNAIGGKEEFTHPTERAKFQSLALKDAGINGIKYLDGSSRSKGEGNYNYVIFDAEAIKVLETYYQGGADGAKGGVTFLEDGRAVIHAFEGADISTIVHEVGHIFRRDLSGADLKAAEDWAGVKDGMWTREAEEKFARGFEKYLADGSAPSKVLKAVFAKLKDWLVGVYRVIAGSPIDVNLTPEIKGVFDRLLAENPLYRVEVDTKARIEALAETTGTDFFTEMKAKAAALRAQKEAGQGVKKSAAEVAANQEAISARSREVDRLRAEREASAANSPLGIDASQKAADVAEIAETDFFRQLKADRDRIMAQRQSGPTPAPPQMGTFGEGSGAGLTDVSNFRATDFAIYRGENGEIIHVVNISDGKLWTADGKTYDPKKFTRVAGQESLFGTKSETPVMLFQSADPRMPLGGIDQASGFVHEGAILDETYAQSIKPLLDAMRAEARKQSGQKQFNFADLPPEVQAGLNSYVKTVTRQDMPSAKLATVRYGEGLRDAALLNYNKKYGFDKYILDPLVPYQFWTTRTGMNTIVRLLDKPAMFATLFRTMRFMSQYERDLPDRLKGKIKVEVPFLPEWMGGSVYIDPLKAMFPILNFLQPFEQMQKDQNAQVMEAERVLQEWAQAEKYSQAEIGQAVQTRSGSVWEAALAEASIRRKAEISNPMDFMSAILGPAWYLTTPYKLAMGQGNEISQLPITRTAQAIQTATAGTWAEGLGNAVGLLAKPEQIWREKNGLPQYGEYSEYYIDRQIANLVAEGLVTPDQAKMAMIERSGDVYAMAEERVRQELMMRVPGGSALYAGLHGGIPDMLKALPTSMFGAGILPEGELKYRGLKEKWNAAWDAYDAGDKDAIGRFFEDHPEYEVYLMKGQTPDERLRNMLTSQIWDSYMGMDKATRKIVTAQLGPMFQHSFLNSETRSPESLDVETLARWSMMLGNDVPETPATEQVVNTPQADQPMLEGFPTQTSAAMAQYDMQKSQMFPQIGDIQNLYYASSDADRAQILTIYPQLREYWDWRRTYIEANPQVAPFLDKATAEGIMSGELNAYDYGLSPDQAERLITYYNTEYSTPVYTADYYLKGATPFLMDSLSAHQLTGAPLTEGSYKELELIWKAYGMPGESFNDWLENVIYATIGY